MNVIEDGKSILATGIFVLGKHPIELDFNLLCYLTLPFPIHQKRAQNQGAVSPRGNFHSNEDVKTASPGSYDNDRREMKNRRRDAT